ncbi:MAG: dethiobiotin synthase, partial [Actinomycetota bacterium]
AVRYVKPVQTGLAPGAPGGDAGFVAAAAGGPADELLRYAEPLAPAVAAERAGRPIDAGTLVDAIRSREAGCDLLLVEGSGGLLVPLTDTMSMADLAGELQAELVVVTRPGVGTLNQTALTLEAAARRDLPIAGLVVCGFPVESGVTERTNLERLEKMAPILEVIPEMPGLEVERDVVESFWSALEDR